MTYRNKLRLRRALILASILLLVIVAVLIIGYGYLGRYVVYTEDGAYFSFRGTETVAASASPTASPPVSPVLVTGASVAEEEILGEEHRPMLAPNAVKGILLDYDTLADGSTLYSVDLADDSVNTLVLEMRKSSTNILTNEPVQTLIERAIKQDVRLVAMISCLDDSNYAQSHHDESLKISGGALWMSDSGTYWLDPGNKAVQDYIVGLINQLIDMGFDEVVLNRFSLPDSSMIIYDSGDSTREDILADAYEAIEEAIGIRCTLGILVTNPDSGHQAFDVAEHLYVKFEDGSAVRSYMENHPDYYISLVTSSHDTRFNDYGKITATKLYDTSDGTPSPANDTEDEEETE